MSVAPKQEHVFFSTNLFSRKRFSIPKNEQPARVANKNVIGIAWPFANRFNSPRVDFEILGNAIEI